MVVFAEELEMLPALKVNISVQLALKESYSEREMRLWSLILVKLGRSLMVGQGWQFVHQAKCFRGWR